MSLGISATVPLFCPAWRCDLLLDSICWLSDLSIGGMNFRVGCGRLAVDTCCDDIVWTSVSRSLLPSSGSSKSKILL